MTRSEIVRSVADAVADVAPQARTIAETTCLMGNDAILDSVGFVTFLVALEQKLGNEIDLSTAFISQGTVEESQNPFLTVGSLAAHIELLLGAAKA